MHPDQLDKREVDVEHSDRHRESCIACMPEELGQCFHQIHLRVVWMQRVWTQHRQLFPLDNRHAPLLQRTAPEFFQIVFDELWDATLLWIAKLLDKPEGHNKEMGRVGNLTLAALIGICPEESRDPLWKDQLGALKVKAATILAHRDSRIGHLDRGQALGRDLTRCQPLHVQEVEVVLEGIYGFMNDVAAHFGMERQPYGQMQFWGSAEDLLKRLERAEEEWWMLREAGDSVSSNEKGA